jgi:HAD superfamily hydrolase (TIGR01509 family)
MKPIVVALTTPATARARPRHRAITGLPEGIVFRQPVRRIAVLDSHDVTMVWDSALVLRAALIDVGGTLWPEKGPYIEWQSRRLQKLFPQRDEQEVARLVRELNEPTVDWESPAVLEQDTDALIEDVLSRHGPKDVSVSSVRRAMCVPASEGAELFPGAVELLKTMRELELRTALVSNTAWRDAESYKRDFAYFGAGDLIDAIVTSLDLKVRKPHDAIFHAAIEMAGCNAKECVFIGDSEEKDIIPAVQLGMRSLLVAIEQPSPSTTAADATATSLEKATEIIRSWANASRT